jgi:hypothetical protein
MTDLGMFHPSNRTFPRAPLCHLWQRHRLEKRQQKAPMEVFGNVRKKRVPRTRDGRREGRYPVAPPSRSRTRIECVKTVISVLLPLLEREEDAAAAPAFDPKGVFGRREIALADGARQNPRHRAAHARNATASLGWKLGLCPN